MPTRRACPTAARSPRCATRRSWPARSTSTSPKYYDYFQTKSFSYGKRTYGNHNNLLGKNGIDGIKTGYINASGYNLMTAARTGNKHIVVIGFGFNKAGSRDAKVAELVKKYLPKARSGSYLDVAMIPEAGPQGQFDRAGRHGAGRLGTRCRCRCPASAASTAR